MAGEERVSELVSATTEPGAIRSGKSSGGPSQHPETLYSTQEGIAEVLNEGESVSRIQHTKAALLAHMSRSPLLTSQQAPRPEALTTAGSPSCVGTQQSPTESAMPAAAADAEVLIPAAAPGETRRGAVSQFERAKSALFGAPAPSLAEAVAAANSGQPKRFRRATSLVYGALPNLEEPGRSLVETSSGATEKPSVSSKAFMSAPSETENPMGSSSFKARASAPSGGATQAPTLEELSRIVSGEKGDSSQFQRARAAFLMKQFEPAKSSTGADDLEGTGVRAAKAALFENGVPTSGEGVSHRGTVSARFTRSLEGPREVGPGVLRCTSVTCQSQTREAGASNSKPADTAGISLTPGNASQVAHLERSRRVDVESGREERTLSDSPATVEVLRKSLQGHSGEGFPQGSFQMLAEKVGHGGIDAQSSQLLECSRLLQLELETLREENRQVRDRFSSLEARVSTVLQKVETHEEHAARTDSCIQQLVAEGSGVRKEVDHALSLVKAVQASCEDAGSSLVTLQQDREGLLQRVAVVETRASLLSKERTALMSSVTLSHEKLAHLDRVVTEAVPKVSELKGDATAKASVLRELTKRVILLEHKAQVSHRELESTRVMALEGRQREERLREEKETYKAQVEELKGSLSCQETRFLQEVATLRTTVNAMEADKRRTADDVQRLARRVEAQERELIALTKLFAATAKQKASDHMTSSDVMPRKAVQGTTELSRRQRACGWGSDTSFLAKSAISELQRTEGASSFVGVGRTLSGGYSRIPFREFQPALQGRSKSSGKMHGSGRNLVAGDLASRTKVSQEFPRHLMSYLPCRPKAGVEIERLDEEGMSSTSADQSHQGNIQAASVPRQALETSEGIQSSIKPHQAKGKALQDKSVWEGRCGEKSVHVTLSFGESSIAISSSPLATYSGCRMDQDAARLTQVAQCACLLQTSARPSCLGSQRRLYGKFGHK